MYNIMIVDDEPVIRKGLINFIDWQAEGCSITAQASDGVEAVELLKSAAPDIVITDIKMPGMDGIELSRYIHESYPSVKVIILTGYADFSYAQSAIRYGVVDFVLKPTSTPKILEAVNKAKDLIEREKEKENVIKYLEEKVKDSLAVMREKFFHDIVSRIITDESIIDEMLRKLDIRMDCFLLMLMEIDNHGGMYSPDGTREESDCILALKNVVSLAFKDSEHFNIPINDRQLCTFLIFKGSSHGQNMQTVFTSCEEILDMVEMFMKFTVTIGISGVHYSGSKILCAYEEAVKALAEKFYNNNEISVYISDASCSSSGGGALHRKYIDEIVLNVQKGDADAAVSALNEMFEKQKMDKQPIEYIKNISMLLCSLCIKLLPNQYEDISKIVKNGETLYLQIFKCKSINSLFEILSGMIRSVSLYLRSSVASSNYIIRKALEYINEHYHENIRLPNIAQYVHVNGSYLSRLFRKETGETLTEAITRVRIEKAKELLLETDLKTYEVACRVGIEDAAYFSQLFKKYTGFNPKEYKYINTFN